MRRRRHDLRRNGRQQSVGRDDALTVETRIAEIGAATLSLDQQIRRDGETIVALDVLVACIGRDGRPRRVPPGLRAALMKPALIKPPIVQLTP